MLPVPFIDRGRRVLCDRHFQSTATGRGAFASLHFFNGSSPLQQPATTAMAKQEPQGGTLTASTAVRSNASSSPCPEPSSGTLDQECYLGSQGQSPRCSGSHPAEKSHCSLDFDAGDLHPSQHHRPFYSSSMEREKESRGIKVTHLFAGPFPRSHPQGNAAKGLHTLLRFVNVVCITLILLFCIAVLNLLSTPTRPTTGTYEHSSPASVVATNGCLKGIVPLSIQRHHGGQFPR